jgi:hypothetical protein
MLWIKSSYSINVRLKEARTTLDPFLACTVMRSVLTPILMTCPVLIWNSLGLLIRTPILKSRVGVTQCRGFQPRSNPQVVEGAPTPLSADVAVETRHP